MGRITFIALLLLCCIALIGVWRSGPRSNRQNLEPKPHVGSQAADSVSIEDSASGAQRAAPSTNNRSNPNVPARPAAKPPESKEEPYKPKQGAGRRPAVKAEGNPHIQSVVEAWRTRQHPERLSVFVKPKPFDLAAFESDPQSYLNIVEPGRIWQTAKAGEGVPGLRTVGESDVEIHQGESVELKVKTAPSAPVTFASFDSGAFPNKLTSITVRADEQGVATTRFTATPGTLNDVNIVAASPLASGQVSFAVNVRAR